jgi:hypothetical protein
VASRRPDLSGADVLLRDEGARDALRNRHTEWSRITLGGMSGRRERYSLMSCSRRMSACPQC